MPSAVVSSATMPTGNPTSRATEAVFGPMQTRSVGSPRPSSGTAIEARLRTAEPLARMIASAILRGRPPQRRLDLDGAIGDDRVHGSLLSSRRLVSEPGVGDVGLQEQHASVVELPEPCGDVLEALCATKDGSLRAPSPPRPSPTRQRRARCDPAQAFANGRNPVNAREDHPVVVANSQPRRRVRADPRPGGSR